MSVFSYMLQQVQGQFLCCSLLQYNTNSFHRVPLLGAQVTDVGQILLWMKRSGSLISGLAVQLVTTVSLTSKKVTKAFKSTVFKECAYFPLREKHTSAPLCVLHCRAQPGLIRRWVLRTSLGALEKDVPIRQMVESQQEEGRWIDIFSSSLSNLLSLHSPQ